MNSYYGFKPVDDDLKMFWYPHIPFVVWNNIYRRSSLVALDLTWDERILSLQDSDYNMHAIIKGAKYKYSADAKIDYYWRVIPNSNSITTKIRKKTHLESHLYLFEKLYTNMSDYSRRDCMKNVQMRMIELAKYFAVDHDLYNRFLNLSAIKDEAWFYYRMKAFGKHACSKVWQYILFPSLSLTMRNLHKQTDIKINLLCNLYINNLQ